MKAIHYLITVLFLMMPALQANAQEGGRTTEERQLPVFTKILLDGMLNVTLEQGDSRKAIVTTEAEDQGKVEMTVDKGKLRIVTNKLRNPGDLKVHIICTELDGLELNGAAELKSSGAIKSDQLNVVQNGATNGHLELDVKGLTATVNGASTLVLKGFVNNMTATVSGAGDLKAKELQARIASVNASGAGSAVVNVSEEITGTSSGAANIKVLGDPAVKTIKESGINGLGKFNGADVKINSHDYGDSVRVRIGELDIEVIDGDTTRVRVGGAGIQVDEKGNVTVKRERKHRFDGHWAGFDLGVNGYLNPDFEMDLPKEYEYLDLVMQKSITVHLNFLEQNFNLIRNKFGLITGLGLEYTNYRFDNDVLLTKGEDGIARLEVNEELNDRRDYEKSKLVVNYLNLPLLLEYQTNRFSKSNSFHFTAGVVGSLRIGTHTKTVWNDGGKQKNKVRDDFYLHPFKLESTVRLGWGKIDLFGNYSLLPLFRKDKGPEVYPFSLGLTLTSW